MNLRTVRLVLDTSAVVAYHDPKTSVHVGEPIAQVDENGGAFTAPMLCLAEASQVVGLDWVSLLVTHEAFRPAREGFSRWRELAVTLRVLGDAGASAALVAANEYDCLVLTARPQLYAALGDDPPIIPVG